MDEPAAKVEFSYLDEEHTFDLYEDGTIKYYSSESSLLDRLSRATGMGSEYDFKEENPGVNRWLESWSDIVGHGSPSSTGIRASLTIRVNPEYEYHDADKWSEASFDRFNVETHRDYNTEVTESIDDVGEMLLELDHRPQVLNQMAENPSSELAILVDTVLGVDLENPDSLTHHQ